MNKLRLSLISMNRINQIKSNKTRQIAKRLSFYTEILLSITVPNIKTADI
jgi:hypothetical protein